jgi:hypothetical protein
MSTMKFNKWQSVDGVTRNAVLQVVTKEVTTTTSTTSETFVDATDMFLAITPTSATSKILVTFIPHFHVGRTSSGNYFGYQVLRDSTTVFTPWVNNATGFLGVGFNSAGATNMNNRLFSTIQFLDSPSTTNLITYKLQIALYENANSGYLIVNDTSTTGVMKSVITLMEIAQ